MQYVKSTTNNRKGKIHSQKSMRGLRGNGYDSPPPTRLASVPIYNE